MIRQAALADAGALARIGLETFIETFLEGFAIPYPPADLEAFVARAYTAEAFAARLADPLFGLWIAEEEGRAIGYATAGPCGLPHPDVAPGDLELKQLYIRGAAQGGGLGRALFDTTIDWMVARQPVSMWLGVWSGNLKAQRFYAVNGFVKVGKYRFPVGAWHDDEHIMRRIIA